MYKTGLQDKSPSLVEFALTVISGSNPLYLVIVNRLVADR